MGTHNITEEQEKTIALMQHLDVDCFIFEGTIYEGVEDDLNEDYENNKEDYDDFEDYIKQNCNIIDEIDGKYYDYGKREYMVLSDMEADDEWERNIEDYIDQVCMSQIPEHLQYYFDREKFIDDAKYEGRGHSLSSYDGYEHSEKVNGTDYYIYRTN